MSLEEELAKELAKQISDEMDAEIIFNLFHQSGWHACLIDPWRHNSQLAVIQWCNQYAGKQGWAKSGNNFLFRDGRVATMFRIHWA